MNKPEENVNTCSPMSACRQSGKAVLKDRIAILRRQADQLQVIHDMLPEKPTSEQDEAIWCYLCR